MNAVMARAARAIGMENLGTAMMADIVARLGDEEVAKRFIRVLWLAGAEAAMRHARAHAALTVEQVAERMGVTPRRVRQIESGVADGTISLHSFVDYLMACGHMPDPTWHLSPVGAMRDTLAKAMRRTTTEVNGDDAEQEDPPPAETEGEGGAAGRRTAAPGAGL
jgi:transcriptional regulator with XRE-family HTH domain